MATSDGGAVFRSGTTMPCTPAPSAAPDHGTEVARVFDLIEHEEKCRGGRFVNERVEIHPLECRELRHHALLILSILSARALTGFPIHRDAVLTRKRHELLLARVEGTLRQHELAHASGRRSERFAHRVHAVNEIHVVTVATA